METIESNKLIAEFMGCEFKTYEKYLGLNELCVRGIQMPNEIFPKDWKPIRLLEYKSSWDWLMLVVEKIESMFYAVGNAADFWYDDETDTQDKSRLQYVCIISNRHSRIIINSANRYEEKESKKIATYIAVVEFIKWHNNKT